MRRSDVYSLGVLLYELLIGAVPFDTATLRNAGLAEMLRIIREEEAPSLSRKLTSMGAAATDIAARRQTDPVSLRRLVDGDLNSITMKALEKARERRYASVSDLAADIQRHMEHRPVLASPPGRLYRARKFLRRHRLAALGTAAGLVFLVLSGVTAWSLSHRDSATRPTLTDKDTIVLADFDNKTGDPVFDDTLRQGLSVELQQSPFLSLISDRQVQQTLALMGQPKDARLTSEVAQQICERTASAAVLEGSIARVGSQYVLGLRARNCNTGNILDQEQAQAAKREDVLNSLSRDRAQIQNPGGRIAGYGGKALDAARRGDDIFTRSLEGLQHRNQGERILRECRGHTLFPARCRNRSQIRDGARHVGALYSDDRRVGAVGREHDESLATAGSRQRSGEVFHRLYLRPAGDGKSGKGVPNPRVVASDISSRGATKSPGFVRGPFHSWDRPIRKSD